MSVASYVFLALVGAQAGLWVALGWVLRGAR